MPSRSLACFVGRVEFFPTAVGLAVAIGPKIVSLDVFLNAPICCKTWRRIVRGCALDAIRSQARDCTVTTGEVRSLPALAAHAAWVAVPPAGAGQEHRGRMDQWSASLLSLDGELVHASFVCSPSDGVLQPLR